MKKHISLILAIALMVTTVPLFAFAAEEGTQQTAGTEAAAETAQEPAYKDCVVNEGGKLVYYDINGQKATFTGWKTIGGAKYWANASGTIAKKPVKIPGKKTVTKKIKKKKGGKWVYKKKKVTEKTNDLYMFGTDGKLITKKGLFKYKGNRYFGKGKGVLKTGWVASGKKAMYFYPKSGKMARNTKIGHLKIPKSGKLGEAYALGIKQLDKMGWTLENAYTFSYRLSYSGRGYRTSSSEKYSLKGFKYKTGNCYVMAATFYVMAKLMGYDVHQVEGRVDLPHSWTVIKEKGGEYVYDPNFRNETGRNGYRIWYGKRGTWRYRSYHKMN